MKRRANIYAWTTYILENTTMLKNEFDKLLKRFEVIDDVDNVKKATKIEFDFKGQKLGIIIFEVEIDDHIYYDSETSHYIHVDGDAGPYKHTKAPRGTPEEALKESMITLFQMFLIPNVNKFKWIKNINYPNF